MPRCGADQRCLKYLDGARESAAPSGGMCVRSSAAVQQAGGAQQLVGVVSEPGTHTYILVHTYITSARALRAASEIAMGNKALLANEPMANRQLITDGGIQAEPNAKCRSVGGGGAMCIAYTAWCRRVWYKFAEPWQMISMWPGGDATGDSSISGSQSHGNELKMPYVWVCPRLAHLRCRPQNAPS